MPWQHVVLLITADVPADDGNGFNLPSSDNLFPDANDTSQVVMSSQVISQPNNPFVGQNSTDNTTLNINSAVVMLSLTNETGAPLDLCKSVWLISLHVWKSFGFYHYSFGVRVQGITIQIRLYHHSIILTTKFSQANRIAIGNLDFGSNAMM